jgi:hypothetical protein
VECRDALTDCRRDGGLVIRYKLAERIGGRKKGKRGIKPRDKKVLGILKRKITVVLGRSEPFLLQ